MNSLLEGLPRGWEKSAMGKVGRYLNGYAFSSKTWATTGRPIIRIQNLTGTGSEFNYFDGDIEPRYVVRPGDLLFSWAATLGVYVWSGPEAVLNQHIFKVESLLNKSFHRYLIEACLDEMKSKTHGSGMVHITKTKFDEIPVLIPPSDEQDEIVRILEEQFSRLDAAAAAIATVRTKADQFRRSLLHAAFTGALTHTGARWMTRGSASCVPVGWRHRDLSDICRVVSGSTPKTTVDAYWGGDIPWITPNDLSKNRGKFVFGGERRLTQAGFDSCSTQMIPAGSVLFSSRAPIGFVAIAGVSMCTNQGFKSAIPGPDIDKEFLYWQLQERTASIRARASGTTFLEISGKRFSATSLVVPPLTEQREIVQILEEQFSRQEASLALVDAVERKVGALRRSLLHAAFSGELTKDWREQDRG